LEIIETIIAIAFGLFLLMFFVPQLFGSESWKEVFEARKHDVGMPREFERRRRWQLFLVVLAVMFTLAGFTIPGGWGLAVFIGIPAAFAFLTSRYKLWDLWDRRSPPPDRQPEADRIRDFDGKWE
jgi:putative copper export protein